LILLLGADQRQEVGEGFGHALCMGGGAKEQGVFSELAFHFCDCTCAETGFQNAWAVAIARDADSVQHQVALTSVLTLVRKAVDILQIEMREAGIDLVVPMVQLHRAESGSCRNHTVDFGYLGWFDGLRIPATEASNETVRISHVADELHGVFEGLSEACGWLKRAAGKYHDQTHPFEPFAPHIRMSLLHGSSPL